MILLDATQMTTREAAHRYLAEQLELPDYYGRNLDALYDCLTDLEDTEITFRNSDLAENSYFERILEVFQEAAMDNPRLSIHFPVTI